MSDKSQNLIWIDLEMTGLDTQSDVIIEIATIVTDANLNIIDEGPNLAIYQSEDILKDMDDWNTRQHHESGLTHRVKASNLSVRQAEADTIDFLKKHVKKKCSPMCGNTICQDRRFLHRLMPDLEGYFHYRNLDVSTVKELAQRWAPEVFKGFVKESSHLALEDIKQSIAELKYYRDTFFKFNKSSA